MQAPVWGGGTLAAGEREHFSLCMGFQLHNEADVGVKHGAEVAHWAFAQQKHTWAACSPGPPQATVTVLRDPTIKTWYWTLPTRLLHLITADTESSPEW